MSCGKTFNRALLRVVIWSRGNVALSGDALKLRVAG